MWFRGRLIGRAVTWVFAPLHSTGEEPEEPDDPDVVPLPPVRVPPDVPAGVWVRVADVPADVFPAALSGVGAALAVGDTDREAPRPTSPSRPHRTR
ncbi:hypothetical protein [Streptomyces monashensis]|uniref:Uncharacterized protein n=1 Tax=Streptomyces monashensis TaxID=1678012 RepID=A0A1S2Q6B5_9ACTN|nr:hypothetical protein BIV23_26565 [Streptomyces monashensis]